MDAIFRAYRPTDELWLEKNLSFLEDVYPDFKNWLKRKLQECQSSGAFCTLAILNEQPVGVIIETPKANSRYKISTLYVEKAHRHQGIGRALLVGAIFRAEILGCVEVYLTLSDSSLQTNLYSKKGFEIEHFSSDRYQKGHTELVLVKHLE